MSAVDTFPRRGANSRWYNNEPMTDLNEALSFLADEGTSIEPLHLRKCEWGETLGVWELVAPWFRSGSSGGDASGESYYQIDPALAEQLVKERLVEPYVQKYWGGATAIPNKLVITPRAKERIKGFEKELRKKAETFLTPGIHTDLTGKAASAGWGRSGFRSGRFYCEFMAPGDIRCRVYPETGEVVFPYPPPRE